MGLFLFYGIGVSLLVFICGGLFCGMDYFVGYRVNSGLSILDEENVFKFEIF